ncbi:MAG TPA: SAM hydroxide adenosyltransferase [Candidatus Saccharimonadales bacterium]|nr:SAM hydroxide adenosyltransferase [Candidatus Saccharimonadales bacterium]
MGKLIGSIVTDCADDNARARQELRFKSLFGVMPSFLGVSSYNSIEAAGNLVEQLDILTNFPLAKNAPDSVLLVNVAPRSGDIKKKWENGTPFCMFRTGRTLVASTYEGHCLALARDLGITDSVELFDIPTVMKAAVEWGELTKDEAKRIVNTQFRSLEFLPLVAYWAWQGRAVPSTTQPLNELPSASGQAWFIDNFGNVKTTLTEKNIKFEEGSEVTLANGTTATCYRRLADVPSGAVALTIGSSGYGTDRFLEVVIGQTGRASERLGLTVGSPILGN